MGGTLAALLAPEHELEVTARGAHLDAIRSAGLRLEGAFGERVVRVTASEVLAGEPDLVVVAVKAHDAPAALEMNRAAIADRPVLVVQNGLGGAAAGSIVDPAQTATGIAVWAAMIERPGVITATATGGIGIGGPQAERFAELLRPVLTVELVADLEGAQWSKLLINMVNALPAITGWSVQQTIQDRAVRGVLLGAMRECVRVADAAGVTLAPLQGMSARLARVVLLPEPIARQVPLKMAARMGPVPNFGSTLQSIQRGVPTEIDALHGAVVEVGSRVGVATPVCRTLVELVHEVEDTGRFVLPRTVVSRVDLARGVGR